MTARVVEPQALETIEILGPTIQFVTEPEGDDAGPCVMRGLVPAGVDVGLHRHADPETFLMLSGDVEAYDGTRWLHLGPGDVFDVPGDETHGFRTVSSEAAVMMIISTVRMGRFFREVAGATPEQFAAVAERYGHAVGLD